MNEQDKSQVLNATTPVKYEGAKGEQTYWNPLGRTFVKFDEKGKISMITTMLNATPINGEIVSFPRSSDE